MKNPFLNSQYLDRQYIALNPLTCLGDFLIKLAESSLFSFEMKDYKTKVNQLSNRICANKWGLADQGLIGMNDREILSRVSNFTNLESELTRIHQCEKEAMESELQSTLTQSILIYDGSISIQQTIKIPVLDSRNRPISIVGMSYDLTRYTSLLYLLSIYRTYYVKSHAAKQLSKYLKLDTYFHTALTYGELRVLLAMVQDTRAKQVEKTLKISCKTISFYISLLKDKLKANIDLYRVLRQLGDYKEWMPKTESC